MQVDSLKIVVITLKKQRNCLGGQQMSIFQKTSAYCLAAILAGAGIAGCGSTGPSNNQGTSYLALGFFTNVDNELVPIGAINSVLNTENPVLRLSGDPVDGISTDGVLIGTENRLSTQFIRQTRVDCTYEVPGSSIQIPGTSTPGGQVLSPAVFDDADNVPRIPQPNPDATVEETGRGQFWFSYVNIIPTDIYAFLNNNANSLPQLPYFMNISCTAIGVTQAGDILETNPVGIFVTFFDQADVASVVSDEGSSSVTEATGEFPLVDQEATVDENTGTDSEVQEPIDTDEFIF